MASITTSRTRTGLSLVLAMWIWIVGGGGATADELVLGASADYVYNSNFFASPNNEDDANSFLIGPTVDISDPDGRFRYDIGYAGAYQVYADQSGVNAWESRLRARAVFDFTTRTSIRVTENFRDISNLRFSRQDIALADTALDPRQDQYYRNDFEIELSHELTRLVDVRLRGAHHWIDFDQNIDRSDSQAVEVGTELDYQIARSHQVGIGVSYIYQDYQHALVQLGSKAEYATGYLSWNWDVTDQIRFSANGGPSWVRSEDDDTHEVSQRQFVGGFSGDQLFIADIRSCDTTPPTGTPLASLCDFATPGFPPIPASSLGSLENFPLTTGERVGSATDVTFFGGASLLMDLADWNLSAIYSRRQSTTSGDALASSLDRVILEFEFAPEQQRWSVFVAGSFDRREALTESTVVDYQLVDGGGFQAERSVAFTEIDNQDSRRDNYTAISGVRTAFTRNQSATLEFRYRRTESRARGIHFPDVDTYFVVLSLDYQLDPIRF
jgi:hypothetical protein